MPDFTGSYYYHGLVNCFNSDFNFRKVPDGRENSIMNDTTRYI